MRRLFRVLLLSTLFICIGLGVAVGYLVANQSAMVFQSPGADLPTAAIDQAIAGSQRISIKTTDGEVLAGWYRPPADGQVVFLYFHGNIGALERGHGRWNRIFEHGAGLLAFSYRGYPGSTGTADQAGLFEDGRAAYRWLRQQHQSDVIVLHGLSLGTAVAAKLATEVDARAVILEAGFTAVSDVAAERYPWLPVHALMSDGFPTRDIIDRVRMPIMIAHGTHDTVIPFAHGEALFARAPEPKTFVKIEGGDHSTLVRDGLYDHIWQFLSGLSR
ncbi:MAG: alpha/beta hydrolase [Pseudomonadota bacterium]